MLMFALIALGCFIVLVIAVRVNVFLYTSGAVRGDDRMSGLEAVTLSQEASAEAENRYYLGIGTTDNTMSNYTRKTLVFFGAAILVVSLLGASLLSIFLR